MTKLDCLFFALSLIEDKPIKLLMSFVDTPSSFNGISAKEKTYTNGEFCNLNGEKIENEQNAKLRTVAISLNLLSGTLFDEELGLCTQIQALSEVFESGDQQLCVVRDCVDPYWMLIVHEFIHMEHYLTEKVVDFISEKFFGEEAPRELPDKADIQQKVENSFNDSSILCIANIDLIEPIKVVRDCKTVCNDENCQALYRELCEIKRYKYNQMIAPREALLDRKLKEALRPIKE